jgi:uncharacterized protein YlaI
MEGNRLVHHEQRISALLFVHAHVGSGKQVLQGDKRGIYASPEVGRSSIKGCYCALKGFHKDGGKCKGRVSTMGGFVCRFCNGDSDGDNGSVSLEISIRNRKIIVYVCQDCYSHLTGSAIIRCQYCGNIWLQKDSKIGKGF